jgi:hypothetical protein
MGHRRVDRRGRYGNEVGNSLRRHERDEPMRREGLQARGIYKEVPRPSRRLALATRQKIPYKELDLLIMDFWLLYVYLLRHYSYLRNP